VTVEGRAVEGGVDALLSTLGHDLRSPLNAIIGFSDLLRLELPGPLNEAQRHGVAEIRAAGDAMLRMTDALVDLARVEVGAVQVEVAPVSLGPFLDEIRASFQAMAAERGLTLGVDPSGSDRCQTDAGVLARILSHLVRNGISATESGGVTIRAEEHPGGRVRIEVVDTGTGISEHDRAMLFRPFDRSASDLPRQGTGLGLFVSRRLADLVGAELTMETEIGRGSTFGIVVPGDR
jgi:protein-histidine pros-kinase